MSGALRREIPVREQTRRDGRGRLRMLRGSRLFPAGIFLLVGSGFVVEDGWAQSTLTIVDSRDSSGAGTVEIVRGHRRFFAVVGDYDNRQIDLVQDDPGAPVDTVDVSGRPTDIACFDDGACVVSLEEGEIGMYQIAPEGSGYTLMELDRVPSGGELTTGVDVAGDIVVGVSRGANGMIRSFRRVNNRLVPVDDSPAGVAPHVVAIGIVHRRSGVSGGASAATKPPRSIVAVANDGSNDLSLFALDEDGNLTTLDPSFPVGGRPRNLRFSPDGRFLFAALGVRTPQQPQLRDEIGVFAVSESGALSVLGRTFGGGFFTDVEVVPDGLVAATVSENARDEVRVFRRRGGELELDATIEIPGAPGQPPSFKKLAAVPECGSVHSTRILISEYQAGRARLLRWTPTDASPTPCVSLAQERFEVRVDWSVPGENRSGVATGSRITDDTGSFWFFDPANVELVVKVLDARVVNGHFWVFYGALSDVEYTITITDTETGAVRRYSNPAGTQASGADIQAFPDAGGGSGLVTAADLRPHAAAATCATTGDALCLAGNRFEVRVDWSAAGGQGGAGNAVALSTDTGYFWFFDDDNVELIVKVLDARVINGKFWVFYGALSDVEYTITVTDTETGAERIYHNPAGHLGSGSDTSAF